MQIIQSLKQPIAVSQHPRIGIGVIPYRDGKVLLGKRLGSHGAGTWAFAGGHLEFGEAVATCARRELIEETGLIAKDVKLGPWVENIFEQKHYITLFTLVETFEGEAARLEPEKCKGWHWFALNALPSPLFPSIVFLIQLMQAKDSYEYLSRFTNWFR